MRNIVAFSWMREITSSPDIRSQFFISIAHESSVNFKFLDPPLRLCIFVCHAKKIGSLVQMKRS